MQHDNLIPKSIADVKELARTFARSGAVSDLDLEAARKRAAIIGCEPAECLEADMFLKIMAGASRGIDPATACGYFAVYNGAVRAVREAPLAILLRSGVLEDIDERIVTFTQLQELEYIASGPPRLADQSEEEHDLEMAEHQVVAARWLGRDGGKAKLAALQVRVYERMRMLEQEGRTDGKGYEAAICAVLRAGVWSVRIFDLDQARARGMLEADNDWWRRYPREAMTYAARQPLLRVVFGDVLGGLVLEEADAQVGTSTIPAGSAGAAPHEGADSDGDLREGVARAS